MREEVKVPSVGESITDGVLAAWSKQDGDSVEVDDALFDFETDKVTMPVNSPFAGVLHIQVQAGSKVNVGDVVGFIDTDAKRPTTPTAPAPSTPSTSSTQSTASAPPAPSATEDFSPSVRRMIEEYDIQPGDIAGTGKGGRVTKEDVIRFIEQHKTATDSQKKAEEKRPAAGESSPAVAGAEAAPAAAATAFSTAVSNSDRRQTRRPMSPLRLRVAERLVQAHQAAAMVTTYNEADMSSVLRLRDQYNEAFEKRYGIRMGFMSFFIKAAVDALKTVPAVNAQIDGDDIVENHFYDIGVAVSTDKGLVVPILRDCDRRSLADLEMGIQDFARRARERKLTLDDLQGGSFSISNGGVFGSLLSAPMLNPPQSGILGMHAIKKRPVVVDDQIVIRPMMYLALTYDHRLVDGREGVTFLKRIVECIENPERLFLEV